MTTKDFLYLGAIALTALAFYCHGFFSGVARARRMYERLLGNISSADEIPPNESFPKTRPRNLGGRGNLTGYDSPYSEN